MNTWFFFFIKNPEMHKRQKQNKKQNKTKKNKKNFKQMVLGKRDIDLEEYKQNYIYYLHKNQVQVGQRPQEKSKYIELDGKENGKQP